MNAFEKYLYDHHVESIGNPPPDLRKIFPEGSMLFDVRYRRSPEEFEVVYLDPNTKRLEVKYVPAIVDIWFVKPEHRYVLKDFCVEPYFKNKMREQHKEDDAYQIPQLSIDKLYRVYCKCSQIQKMIAQHAGEAKMYSEDGSHLIDMTYKEYFEHNIDVGPFNTVKKRMNQNPFCYKGDFKEDAYFRIRWVHEFGEECDVSKVTCGFLDIEIDVMDNQVNLSDPHDVRQPISTVTSIFPIPKKVYVDILQPRPISTFAEHLRDKMRPILDQVWLEYNWIKNHQQEFISMILGNPSPDDCPIRIDTDKDNLKYLQGYDVELRFYEMTDGKSFQKAEAMLIYNVFDHINKHRPMFMFAWNAPFDFNYLPNRYQWLGYDPTEPVVPNEFKSKEIRYQQDNSGNFQLKTSRDWFYIASYTQYACQERLYAGVRKSQSEEPSYRLTAIGDKVAGIRKLTDTKSGTFREFQYTDFLKFILYNVRDVVVQLAIEDKVSDAKTLYARSYDFTTGFDKCFQETHIVRNSKETLYEGFGYVMANKTVIDTTIDGSFQGAYVADPKKNSPTGLVLSGNALNNIIYGSADLDATAMYPSQKMAYNLDKCTMIFKCKIDNNVFRSGRCINRSYNQSYTWKDAKGNEHETDMASPIMNSFKNHNVISLLSNWMNAPLIPDIIDRVHRRLSC